MSKKINKKRIQKPKDRFVKEVIEVFAKSPYTAYNFKQVSARLGIQDKSSRALVNSILYDIAEKDIIVEYKRGKFKLNPDYISEFVKTNTVVGVVDMKSTGKAYILSPELDTDVFIHSNNTGKALHGDKVKVHLFPKRGGRKNEGKITEIIERASTQFVGILQKNKEFAFLIPSQSNQPVDFFIPLNKTKGAEDGQKVIIRLTSWPEKARNPFGEVIEVLGDPGLHDVEMKSILADFDIASTFDKTLFDIAESIDESVSKEEIARRKDFREVFTCTIDPIDAKDFDDALSFRWLENGNREVGVHIADVSHYVTVGSPIDKEAYKRATSIYLVDRVIPMLPEKLSNKVCSLRPNEEKLCFSAVFEFDGNNKLKSKWFGKTVIHSDRRFTYEEVQDMIEGNPGDFKEELMQLNEISMDLRQRRFEKGSIAFNSNEIRFELDEDKKPIRAFIKEQKEANKLIEDFMLLANRKVAEEVGKIDKKQKKNAKSFIYRIHDQPKPDKLEVFSEFLSKLGYRVNFDTRKGISESLNKLFEEVKGKGEETMIETIAVRTMSKAIYSTQNIGHYGLAFDYYSHFTSPIRRYPDLMVHRLLEAYLSNQPSVNATEYEEYCEHCSNMERKAMAAERESINYKKVEFMLDKIGEEFPGKVTGVSKWGIFVELSDSYSEGMVSFQNLTDDYYYLDEDNYRIMGQQSGKEYRLGDRVRVKVLEVNLLKRQMDLEMIT